MIESLPSRCDYSLCLHGRRSLSYYFATFYDFLKYVWQSGNTYEKGFLRNSRGSSRIFKINIRILFTLYVTKNTHDVNLKMNNVLV